MTAGRRRVARRRPALSGDITISLAGVDLVELRLHALIRSIRAEERR
ncbi:gas vesicle protein GvpJ [Jiangella alkaliphila]